MPAPPDRQRPLVRPPRRGRVALAALGAVCATALGGCGNTIQDQQIAPRVLEQLVTVREYPVYWLGAVFDEMQVSNVLRDPSGAFAVQYGDCLEGGQSTCVPPLEVVSSPDNAFHPVSFSARASEPIRGARAALAQGGRTIEISTAGVVIDIYAQRPALARAAAQTMVAINQGGAPGAPLPAPLPTTGFGSRPLAGQLPNPSSAHVR